MLPEPEHLPQHLHFLALPRKGEKEAITINATTIMTIFAKTSNNNNNKEQEYQCRCTAGVAISEVLVRHQLAKPSSALSLNVPRAMRRKPKQVYVLRHGHLFGDKTDNGICAHLVEPLEGG